MRTHRGRLWDAGVGWAWFILGVLFIVNPWGRPAFAEEIPWVDYDEALKKAQTQDKPVFLYFFTRECPYCEKMDSHTLASKRVAEQLREGFISVRIDAERQPHLARRYLVRGFPTIWFLNPQGKPVYSLPGYVEPEEFTRVLRYVEGGHYRSKSFREFLSGS